MKKYTVLDFAEDILRSADRPLVYQEVWEAGIGSEYEERLGLTGKTPRQTVASRLFTDVRDNPDSRFIKVGKNPARFFLKARKDDLKPEDLISSPEEEKFTTIDSPQSQFAERDLHPLLAYYASTNTGFNRGKRVYTKTIYHEKSMKTKPSEWTNPDMVGFYLPLEDWDEKLIEFNKVADRGAAILYSFELKKQINKGNYRESFFQAVSNSSWANEGYLVAAHVQQQDDLLSELERLSSSFGIGVIQLDLGDIDSSFVLFPPRHKDTLDWEMMNKLCEQSPDFKLFIDNIRKDYDVNTIHVSEYDEIPPDPDEYLKKILNT